MSKITVEVLIIDDDRSRDSMYEKFFANLSGQSGSNYIVHPLIAQKPSEALSLLQSKRACLVVLDMVLAGAWENTALQIYECIKRLRYTIALLSNKFDEPNGVLKTHGVLVTLASVPKVGFLPYVSSIQKFYVNSAGPIALPDALPSEIEEVWNFMLAEAQGYDRHWTPSKPEEITFLHLTDTHFGVVTPDLLNVVGMEQGASSAGLKADYLLWTGDVTEHGSPHEFELAEKFVTDLRSTKLLVKSCPISITPGNHDLCWPLALASRLESVKDDAENDEKKRAWKLRDDPIQSDLWQFGFSPFNTFFEGIVGERRSNDGYRLLTQWVHLGIAVLELPLEAHVVLSRWDQDPKPQPFVTNAAFQSITDEAIKAFLAAALPKFVCVIVMIHGRRPDNAKPAASRWHQLLSTIEDAGNPTLVFAGHEHATDHVMLQKRLTLVGAPLDERKLEGGLTLPSVGFIQLSGLGTADLACTVTKLKKERKDTKVVWGCDNPRRFKINQSNGHWIAD